MAPQKRKAETYDKSDYFVADDDEPTSGPSNKRSKSTAVATTLTVPEMQKDDDGNEFWEISRARRVTVSDFKGKKMVSVREYYEKDSKWLPGKKGITMTVEQFSALVAVLPQLETLLSEKGENIPRPNYDGGGPVKKDEDQEHDDDSDEDHERKANIDATSDEDEE